MEKMVVQFNSNNRQIRGFVGQEQVLEINSVDWRKLDAHNIPRLCAANGWRETGWGWEIKLDAESVTL